MADSTGPGQAGTGDEPSEQLRPVVTRREFVAGAGVGIAVGAVVAGGIAVSTRGNTQTQAVVTAPGGPAVVAQQPAAVTAPAPGQAQPQTQAPQAVTKPALPLNMRTVELSIDGVPRSVTVDVRESLWEAMVFHLGMSSSNLGCDRAQCGGENRQAEASRDGATCQGPVSCDRLP